MSRLRSHVEAGAVEDARSFCCRGGWVVLDLQRGSSDYLHETNGRRKSPAFASASPALALTYRRRRRRRRQALQAELSGEYDAALKIYKKLMARYDTRYEKNEDSQDSARGTDAREDEEEGDKDGERGAVAQAVKGGTVVGVGVVAAHVERGGNRCSVSNAVAPPLSTFRPSDGSRTDTFAHGVLPAAHGLSARRLLSRSGRGRFVPCVTLLPRVLPLRPAPPD